MPQLIGDFEKDPNHCRIELRSGASKDLFAGGVEASGLAVRAVAGDRIQGVGHREDASADGNLDFNQAVGIAATVEMFLMREDNLSRFGKKRNLAQHVVA